MKKNGIEIKNKLKNLVIFISEQQVFDIIKESNKK